MPDAERSVSRTSSAVAADVDQFGAVLDRHVDHAPVPAQIVHPLQPRDAIELAPFGRAELRLEPGAEREAGKLKRRPGQLRRRAQRLHARRGRPRSLEALRRAIEDAQAAHRQTFQRERGGEPRHAGADDRNVKHRPVLRMHARLEPVLRGRQREQFEVAPEPCFKPGERTLGIGLALFRHQAIVALRCAVGYALAGQGTE